jgi:hypothetical protein
MIVQVARSFIKPEQISRDGAARTFQRRRIRAA